ncbi:hypothetical protein PO878_09130 [Iamia majanohamensis]|uniref:ABC-type glycine betaine transport system substrate-binding domain-containing protein n=1 Tax=Iamia majanohamensis TaxID=467976 RepID=A0AAE9Y896_9ACTN|nr:hypothetical protein [Iamia majanohamensis]WCO68885.1 hypothetical protein PO878_09130 [Iamia majanohamensis]
MPPRLARLLAVLAAVALVAGALVLRSALAGDDGGSDDTEGGGGSDAPVRLLCDADLGDAACEALGALDGVGSVEVATADEALAEMAEVTAPYDAWATLDPWPQILDVARDEDQLPPIADEGDPVPLASSALAVLSADPMLCGEEQLAGWQCVAGSAADGLARVGVPTLASASGPLVLGAAAAGLVESTDVGIDDIDGTDVGTLLDDLLDSADTGTLAEEATAIVTQPGRYDALVTIEGLAVDAAGTAGGRSRGLQVLPISAPASDPTATFGVVLAPLGPDGPGALDRLRGQVTGQTVTDGLAEAGWSGDAARTTGLPAPDLLYRLDEEFTR